jgi:hypothetical protein
MIYEQINNSFQSLANQWRDLAESFRRLASAYPDRQLDLEELPNGLAFLCDHDATEFADDGGFSQQAAEVIVRPQAGMNIQDVINTAITDFQVNQGHFDNVENTFNGLFPVPDRGDPEQVEILDCRENLTDLETYILSSIQHFQELTSADTTIPVNLSGLRDTVDDIASYPMLTSELGITPTYTAPSGPTSTGNGTNTLQRTVDNAVRDVLGRLPRAKDTRSFMLALNQAFQVTEVQGHTQVTWVQRSFSGQTDLGDGVTGAQASLFTRSKVALDSALPLLDGLYPLLPDYDPQLAEASRAIVHSELVEIVSELGIEGGPRVARVDQLFQSLLDSQNTHPIPNQPPVGGGHLGYLETVFGLLPAQVNTLDEERNVTNFIALQDYANSIRVSWEYFRQQWLGKDLGTRLVLLSRTLSVAAETVDEVNFAMDSVFVGSAERQVVSFRDQNGNRVLVEELLSWASAFAGEEAPRLVRDAGKRGAAAIIPTGQVLVNLVARFIQQIPYDPDLPAGLRHPRVLPPLSELRSYLQRIVDLAQDINRPVTAP